MSINEALALKQTKTAKEEVGTKDDTEDSPKQGLA
jgi:hypothetical protein